MILHDSIAAFFSFAVAFLGGFGVFRLGPLLEERWRAARLKWAIRILAKHHHRNSVGPLAEGVAGVAHDFKISSLPDVEVWTVSGKAARRFLRCCIERGVLLSGAPVRRRRNPNPRLVAPSDAEIAELRRITGLEGSEK